MVGIKEVASKELSGVLCPNFSLQEAGPSQRHEDFVKNVVQWLERGGFRCERGVRVESSPYSGYVDIVCEGENVEYVIEVKSYPLSQATLSDYMQLQLYCTKLSRQSNAKRECLLAYRGFTRHRSNEVVFIKVPAEVKLSEEREGGGPAGKHKPGFECFSCAKSKSCLYSLNSVAQPSSPIQRPSLECKNVRNEDIARVYQEAVKDEWCLMRHGTSCYNYYYDYRQGVVYWIPVYVALNGNVVYNMNEVLTPLHILAASLRAVGSAKLSYDGKCLGADELLLNEGLLIEKECDIHARLKSDNTLGLVIVLTEKRAQSDFLRLVDLYRKYEELEAGGADKEVLNKAQEFLQKILKGGRAMCYKTFHGEFVRLLRNASSLPERSVVLEGYALPFIEDVFGERDKDVSMLADELERYLSRGDLAYAILRSLRSEGGYEIGKLSEFQLNSVRKLLRVDREKGGRPFFFLLTSPPGAGKTIVFTIYALARAVRNVINRESEESEKIVIMYPTKTLAKQQLQLLIYTLEELNRELTARGLREIKIALYDGDSNRRKRKLRRLRCSAGDLEYGEDGHVYCGGAEVGWISERDVDDADIVVTNPYKLSSDLLRPEKGWVERIGVIILDEAHHFLDGTTLDFMTALLHRVVIRKQLVSNSNGCRIAPDVILSSATITSSGMPFKDADKVTFRGIGGFLRMQRPNSQKTQRVDEESAKKTVEELAKRVFGEELANCYRKDYEDYYAHITGTETGRKLTLPLVLFSIPEQSPTGTLTEVAVSSLIFSKASLRRRIIAEGITSIFFVDNKELQREIESHLKRRMLSRELSPADKLLVRPYVQRNAAQIAPLPHGRRIVEDILKSKNLKALENYHHLALYCAKKEDLDSVLLNDVVSEYLGGGVQTPRQCYKQAQADALDIIKNKDQKPSTNAQYVPILVHNADLSHSRRMNVEEFIEKARGRWGLVIATSTLEMGVNIENAGVVVQYGLPALPEIVVQRFGRGGRSVRTLFTSVGVLVPRNTGEDVALIDEDYAILRLFGFKPAFLEDARSQARYESVLMIVGFNAYSMRRFDCERGNREAQHYVETSKKMLNAKVDVAKILGTLHDACNLCSDAQQAQGLGASRPIDISLQSLENYLKNSCKEVLDKIIKKCRDYHDIIKDLCENMRLLRRRIMRELLTLSTHAAKCWTIIRTEPYVEELFREYLGQESPTPPLIIGEIFNISMTLVNTEKCINTRKARECCMRAYLSMLAYPKMPDPYVVTPTIDVYTILRKRKKKKSMSINEVYDVEIPLKIRST